MEFSRSLITGDCSWTDYTEVLELPTKRGIRIISLDLAGVEPDRMTISTLLDTGADVLLLQNLNSLDQLSKYSRLIESYSSFHSVRIDSTGLGHLILSKFDIDNPVDFLLPDRAGFGGVVKVRIASAGRPIDLWCTALSTVSRTIRRTQIERIIGCLDPETPNLLAGALNSLDRAAYTESEWGALTRSGHRYSSREMIAIRNAGFESAFEVAGLSPPKVTDSTGKATDHLMLTGLRPRLVEQVFVARGVGEKLILGIDLWRSTKN